MDAIAIEGRLTPGALTLSRRALLLVVGAVAYVGTFQLNPFLLNAVRRAAGFPANSGPWAAFQHLFLYSTLAAVTCAAVWGASPGRGCCRGPAPCWGWAAVARRSCSGAWAPASAWWP